MSTLSTLEVTTIANGIAAAKQLVGVLKPILDQLNIVYDGTGGVKSTVDQAKLDSASNLSGLTKQQLDDGMFALTSVIKGDLATSFTQLTILASRG